MKFEKRKCPYCEKDFVPNIHNQKFCCIAHGRVFRGEWSKERLQQPSATFSNLQQPIFKKNKKPSFKEEISNIHQPLYQVKKGFNLIKKFNNIHEDLVNYMNILKLDTYPEEIRNHCIYIMKESNSFLQNQLKLERDKGVIIVQEE